MKINSSKVPKITIRSSVYIINMQSNYIQIKYSGQNFTPTDKDKKLTEDKPDSCSQLLLYLNFKILVISRPFLIFHPASHLHTQPKWSKKLSELYPLNFFPLHNLKLSRFVPYMLTNFSISHILLNLGFFFTVLLFTLALVSFFLPNQLHQLFTCN